jgi:hypothetical protein
VGPVPTLGAGAAGYGGVPDFLYNKIASGCGLLLGKSGGNLTTSYTESESEFQGEASLWHNEW